MGIFGLFPRKKKDPKKNDRFLARGLEGQEKRENSIYLETLDVANEANLRNAGCHFVRAEWQSQQDFEDMVRDAEIFIRGGRYLKRRRDKVPALRVPGDGEILETLLASTSAPNDMPLFAPWPGLSEADLDSMMNELAKHYSKVAAREDRQFMDS